MASLSVVGTAGEEGDASNDNDVGGVTYSSSIATSSLQAQQQKQDTMIDDDNESFVDNDEEESAIGWFKKHQKKTQSLKLVVKKKNNVEHHPLKGISYIVYIISFMFLTLDLFVDTGNLLGWHYAITTIEFVIALYLCIYQVIRIWNFLSIIKGADCSSNDDNDNVNNYNSTKIIRKALLLLSISCLMQLTIVGMALYSYAVNSDPIEWSFFGISITWGIINPLTYTAVSHVTDNLKTTTNTSNDEGVDTSSIEKKKTTRNRRRRLGPFTAAISIFTRHFTRTPLLLVLGTIFAIAQAILGTYQGAIINDLTKMVTKVNNQGDLVATEKEIANLGGILVLVWCCTNLSNLLFDIFSAKMFCKLEVWLLSRVFDSAVDHQHQSQADTRSNLSAADYQARYASDVDGVVVLYVSLLRGVVVNVLLICTNFVFLAITEWRVAIVTLGFLAMGVTSGPTDLAGEYSSLVQDNVTTGLSLLPPDSTGHVVAPADEEEKGVEPTNTTTTLKERHLEEVIVPLETNLFRKTFFSSGVYTFNRLFSSFLTVVVVTTMAWEVYYRRMDSSEFLGIFFVFKQLQKPATMLSGVIRKAVSKTANLERINSVVFEEESGSGSGG